MITLTYKADLADINGRPLSKAFAISLALAEIDPACRTVSAGRELRATSKAFGFWFGEESRLDAGCGAAQEHLKHAIESLRMDLKRPNACDHPPLRSPVAFHPNKGARLRYWGYFSDWQQFLPDQETSIHNVSQDALLAIADDALGEIALDLGNVRGRVPGLSKGAMIRFIHALELFEVRNDQAAPTQATQTQP